MDRQFGAGYAASVARDQSIAALGDRSVEQALAAGVETKVVWRAVCEVFEVPARER